MIDTLSREARSRLMSRVRNRDTGPEMIVRQLTHRLGYRYRLHKKDLPGKPDLVFASRRRVIFVHGCFWHRHKGCALASMPKSRTSFWEKKFRENVLRDKSVVSALTKAGWRSLVIWQCETKDLEALEKKIVAFLEEDARADEAFTPDYTSI